MDGKLRNMTSVYIFRGNEFLMLFRQGGRVVDHVWVASAGGHFEKEELNDAKACVLRELWEELKMPYTAKFVMEHYLEIGAYNEKLYGGIADGDKVTFVEMPDY